MNWVRVIFWQNSMFHPLKNDEVGSGTVKDLVMWSLQAAPKIPRKMSGKKDMTAKLMESTFEYPKL